MTRRGRYAVVCGTAVAGAALGALALPSAAGAGCSVFSRHPCAPTVCSVFHHGPCFPLYPFPLGQNLQLTVDSTQPNQGEPVDHDHKIDTIRDMFAALRSCWQPPEQDEAREGMQMSVLFAFKRDGEIIAPPRARPIRRRASRMRPARSIGMPSIRRSSAARRCRSAPAWAAPSRAVRSPSGSSTTGPGSKATDSSHDGADTGKNDELIT